ncbi:MAG: DUF1674 domain-containing protein [Woeseiaceae bacterium]
MVKEQNKGSETDVLSTGSTDNNATVVPPGKEQPREIGGRQGPDPTRYGDWEKNGRCIDF